jgi:predicted PolB exonuclease-like 3'-5' exonuclease
MPKLAHVAKLVGMPGKLDVDGSMVDGLYEQGRIEEIRTYCLHDVVQTAFVFLRVELLRGRLSPDSYRERARELWDALEKEPRAEAVLEKADERRTLLLGEGEPES